MTRKTKSEAVNELLARNPIFAAMLVKQGVDFNASIDDMLMANVDRALDLHWVLSERQAQFLTEARRQTKKTIGMLRSRGDTGALSWHEHRLELLNHTQARADECAEQQAQLLCADLEKAKS